MLNGESWRAELRSGLGELIDQIVRTEARADQVFDAIADELQTMKADRMRKFDRAENPEAKALGEPANDWPGAER